MLFVRSYPTKPSSLYKRISRAEYNRLFSIYRQRINNVCTIHYCSSRRVYYALRSLYE